MTADVIPIRERRPEPVKRKSFPKGGRPSPIAKLPDADLVNAYVLSKETKHTLGELCTGKKKTRWIWSALIESIKSGLFGPPITTDVAGPSLRLLLPWLPRGLKRYNLDQPHMSAVATEIIFPLLRDQPDLKDRPDRIEAAIEQRRRDYDDRPRQEARLARHEEQTAALPSNEQPIVAYGEPLWPLPHHELTPPYTYSELCHACWYSSYFFGIARKDWRPIDMAMSARHLTKYLEPLQPGFVNAVRAIFNAYETNPNGEFRHPPQPVNFGY
jgi:hypothetical protein